MKLVGLFWTAWVCSALILSSCANNQQDQAEESGGDFDLLKKYTSVTLTSDITPLSDNQRSMLSLLIDAADEMDKIFWIQAYGNGDSLLEAVSDADQRRFVEINYGPWDRLSDNEPFLTGTGSKPPGANYYPADATKEELESAIASNPELKSLYTMVRKTADGSLTAIPYNEFFEEYVQVASEKLREAAELADDQEFGNYLRLRAEAILTDEYQISDLAWMDMKDNEIDLVFGPIETYEDQLFGYKAAFEAFVLIKDMEWSSRLQRYAELLPQLQRNLPVADEYKRETPGTDSDLGAYDAIYYAGDTNAGSKTIAINLPNDEEVQLQKGTRRLQLKNTMRAKFDKILLPISDALIADDQRDHIKFDAFFGNTMFHEVAHGLGIKQTIGGEKSVREALQNHASAIEEGKADVLGLYMVAQLIETGEWEADVMDHYVTFLASVFRSIRFGASSAHGRANLIRFNFFKEMGAFTKDETTGHYRIEEDNIENAVNALSARILQLQGDGDYDEVASFVDTYMRVPEELQTDLDGLSRQGIPVDIVFNQGKAVLGL